MENFNYEDGTLSFDLGIDSPAIDGGVITEPRRVVIDNVILLIRTQESAESSLLQFLAIKGGDATVYTFSPDGESVRITRVEPEYFVHYADLWSDRSNRQSVEIGGKLVEAIVLSSLELGE